MSLRPSAADAADAAAADTPHHCHHRHCHRPPRPSDARRSRFDAVLRARDRTTGCGFSPELGTAAPCGIVLVYCDDAGRFDTIAVLTSKTQEALNLDDHKAVAPQDFNEMELTVLQGMRTYLPGPFYHNVFLAPGPTLNAADPSWSLAQRAAVGQVMLMDATPLVGPLLDAKLALAIAPVVELAHEYANEGRPNVAVVPFRKTSQSFAEVIKLFSA